MTKVGPKIPKRVMPVNAPRGSQSENFSGKDEENAPDASTKDIKVPIRGITVDQSSFIGTAQAGEKPTLAGGAKSAKRNQPIQIGGAIPGLVKGMTVYAKMYHQAGTLSLVDTVTVNVLDGGKLQAVWVPKENIADWSAGNYYFEIRIGEKSHFSNVITLS